MKTRFLPVILFAVLIGWFLPHPGYCRQEPRVERRLIFFYSPTCKKCQELKADLLPRLEKDFKGRIKIDRRDITRMQDYALLLRLEEKYHPKLDNSVPLFFFEGRFLDSKDLYGQLDRLLKLPQPVRSEEEVPLEGIVYRFRAFKPLTVFSAGLIDGINPCAFTVIIFFISFLAIQGYRRRELLVIGLAFILSVFITYILIGIGLFGFLYRLQAFWIVSKIINIAVGFLSIILGGLAAYDFFKFRHSGRTEGLILQLPPYLKNRIHAIIGSHYRNTPEKSALKRSVFSLILSALITGFLVSIIEAACTGQVYLPTIVFVLKNTHLKLEALGYLLFYNLLFILPLLVIFILALVGVTSGQLSQIFKKRLGLIKILMAVLFFILGLSLLYSYVPASFKKFSFTIKKVAGRQVTPYSWDFDQVKEGEMVKHAFTLKNKSKNIMEITGVRTSCGCTASQVKKTRLGPGESTTLEVEFDSKGYSGPIQQYVYVNTGSLDEPVIRFIITGNIVK